MRSVMRRRSFIVASATFVFRLRYWHKMTAASASRTPSICSVLSGRLAAGEDDRVVDLLQRLGFDLWHDKLRQCDSRGSPVVLKGLADFQEHLGGELTITLLAEVGRGVEVHEMDERIVRNCIDWLEQRA